MGINVHIKLPQKGQVWVEFLGREKSISRSIFRPFQSILNLTELEAFLRITAAYWSGTKLPNFIKLTQWHSASFQRLPEFKSLKPENKAINNKTSLWKAKCIPWVYTVPWNYFVKILSNILPISPEASNYHSQPAAGRCLSATPGTAGPGRCKQADNMPFFIVLQC